MESIWQQINHEAAQVVQRIQSSMVRIVGDDGGIGAGVIWRSDGIIVTNAHVAMGARRSALIVQLSDGSRLEVRVLAADPDKDLAVLAADADGLEAVQAGESGELLAGHWAMALGHPWGITDALTAGIVIGHGADLPEVNDGRQWLALDMQMRPGHSGGPLFDTQGQVIGLNTMIRGPEVSFAIPVDVVKAFVESVLLTHDQQSPATMLETPVVV